MVRGTVSGTVRGTVRGTARGTVRGTFRGTATMDQRNVMEFYVLFTYSRV